MCRGSVCSPMAEHLRKILQSFLQNQLHTTFGESESGGGGDGFIGSETQSVSVNRPLRTKHFLIPCDYSEVIAKSYVAHSPLL